MLYMFLLYWDENAAPEDGEAAIKKHFEFTDAARARNAYVYSEALGGAGTATTVRSTNGKTTMTDGPYIETKEAIGGFYILDCQDLDEALAYANRLAEMTESPIEIRPVMDVPAWDYGETSRRERHSRG